jgi:hypothetical protein
VQLLFRKIQRGGLSDMELSQTQINNMIKEFRDRLIEEYDKDKPPETQISIESEYQWINGYRQNLHECLASGNYSEVECKADERTVK